MNAFEQLVGTVLRTEGYWITNSYKVDLTKKEKQKIGRPSAPRWELDLLAYNGRHNRILVVECKSYLDSRGVVFDHVSDPSSQFARLYKLFNDPILRRTVFGRLKKQLVKHEACAPNPAIALALAAGKFATARDADLTKALFAKRRWALFDGQWLATKLRSSSQDSYENDIGMIAAKLLDRYPPAKPGRACACTCRNYGTSREP